jgi:hypothetical protein
MEFRYETSIYGQSEEEQASNEREGKRRGAHGPQALSGFAEEGLFVTSKRITRQLLKPDMNRLYIRFCVYIMILAGCWSSSKALPVGESLALGAHARRKIV